MAGCPSAQAEELAQVLAHSSAGPHHPEDSLHFQQGKNDHEGPQIAEQNLNDSIKELSQIESYLT